MAYGLKRTDLQSIAQAKVDDAHLLFQNGRFSNSYYLAGYAIEIALKACIAAQISAETIPDKDILRKVLNHEFPVLVGLAGLATALKEQQDCDSLFAANWAIVLEWKPDVRYESTDSTAAQQMLSALTDAASGVLQWIKLYW